MGIGWRESCKSERKAYLRNCRDGIFPRGGLCALLPLAHCQILLSIVVVNHIVCKRGFFVI